MGSIIQLENGNLMNVDKLKNVKDVIQLVQMSNGSLRHIFDLNKNEELVSLDTKLCNIENIKKKEVNNFIYLRLKNGLFILVPDNFKLVTTKDARIFIKSINWLEEGEFIALPSSYRTKHTMIRFDPWDLDDHLYISGIKYWYLNKLNNIMRKHNFLIKDIANKLNAPCWLVRRNILNKDSVNLSYLKKFIKTYLHYSDLYKVINISKGIKNEKSAKKVAKIPYDYKEDLAYTDSVMVGEGYIAPNEKQAIFEFSDKAYVYVLKDLFIKLHGYNASKGNRINLPGFLAYFYHKFLYVPKGNKSKIVEFPKLALLSKDDIAISALRGIIDGEGTLNINKKYNYKDINISSSSLKLVLGLGSVLLRLDISFSIRKSHKDSTWILSIKDVKEFFKKVKYLKHPKKHKMLIKLNKLDFKNRVIIPNVGDRIKQLRKKHGLSSIRLASLIGLSNTTPMEKNGNFSYESLSKINKIFKDKKIDNLLSANLEWCKIVCKKHIKMKSEFVFPMTNGFFFLNHIPVRC